jgi:hypothetical protein
LLFVFRFWEPRDVSARAHTRRGKITIRIDGAPLGVPKRITVKRALELAGATFGAFPGDSARKIGPRAKHIRKTFLSTFSLSILG